jgi:hypothetical protein
MKHHSHGGLVALDRQGDAARALGRPTPALRDTW